MLPPPFPEAARLVHQILSASKTGLSTKGLVKAGIELYRDKLPPQAFYVEEPVNERVHKGKKRHVPEPKLVPKGHPFRSTSYLKKHVLPILDSQDLIRKHIVHPETSPVDPSSDADSPAAESSAESSATTQTQPGHLRKNKVRPTFVWSILSEPTYTAPNLTWSMEDHWKRLIRGREHPNFIGQDYEDYQESVKRALEELDLESGAVERTDEQIRIWKERLAELRTNREKARLSKRKQKGRGAKELKRQERWDQLYTAGRGFGYKAR